MRNTYLPGLAFAGITMTGAILLVGPSSAQVHVEVGIELPPLVFAAPPRLVVLPETYVYAVPDLGEDLYFFDGWWWRPWRGRWYRSHYYDRGWDAYSSVPSFYGDVPHDWRDSYRSRQWRGQPWNYEPMPYSHVEQNWSSWKNSRYWDSHRTWGGHQNAPSQHREQQGTPTPRDDRGTQAAPSQHREQRPAGAQPEQLHQQPRAVQPQRDEQPPRAAQPQHHKQQSPSAHPQHHGQQQPAARPQQHGNDSRSRSKQPHESGGGEQPKGQGNAGKH